MRAFTLIELLLVIAVISIIAALSLLGYRRYFEANRIDKVAISMQHMLEAAMAYYVDHNKWPPAHSCGAANDQDDFVQDYVPNSDVKSYFGGNFCWHDAGAGVSDVTPGSGRLFWTAVNIPMLGTERLTVAQRLAARLPNAVTTSTPQSDEIPLPACNDQNCYVRAEITVPGTSTNVMTASTIAAVGECHTNQTVLSTAGDCRDISDSGNQRYHITSKACPLGTKPVLSITPNFIVMPPNSQSGFKMTQMNAQALSCSQDSEHSMCDAKVTVTTCAKPNKCSEPRDIKTYSGTAVGASYIFICYSMENH